MLLSFAFLATQASVRLETFRVDGVAREALIYPGTGSAPAAGRPMIFAFHGHGGNMNLTNRGYNLQALWPEAIIVYPQGLPTPGMTDPDGKKNGWQQKVGDMGNRDLKFVDTMFARIPGYDPSRVYSMGHSNGGRFTYVLWQQRGKRFAAYGPSAAPAVGMVRQMDPAPAFIMAGEKDPIVPYISQKLSIDAVARLNGIDWSKGTTNGYLKLAPGKNGTELGTYVHPGGHEMAREALPDMIALFKRHHR